MENTARTAVGDVVADLAATGEGEGCCRRGGNHGMAAGVFASAGESARTAVGDDFPEEDVGGGSGGCSCRRGHEITGRPRETSPSADKAARVSVGDVVAGDSAAGRGSTARCCERDHGTAAGIIASAGGKGRADGFDRCHGGHGRGEGGEGAGAATTRRPRDGRGCLCLRGRRPWGVTSLTRPSGGVKAGAAAFDEATGRPRETSPQRTRLRERPWGMSLLLGERERDPPLQTRPRDGHGEIVASTDKSVQTATGDVATDEERGGRVWQLALTRPREGCGDHRLGGQIRVECREGCCLGQGCQSGGEAGHRRGGRDHGTTEG